MITSRLTRTILNNGQLRTTRVSVLACLKVNCLPLSLTSEFLARAHGREPWITQDDVQDVQDADALRWKVEQFHRETKQVTGLESCQCRKARIVRNHIGCAILVWIRLKQVAQDSNQTIYQVKHGLLSDYLRQQLISPTIKMTLA